MIIAIDFDGTIAKTTYPEIVDPLPGAFQTIEQLFYCGHKLILWTLREDDYLTMAKGWLKEKNVLKFFYLINNNCSLQVEKWKSDPRKIAADVYIDDRAIGWTGWKAVRDFFCLDI